MKSHLKLALLSGLALVTAGTYANAAHAKKTETQTQIFSQDKNRNGYIEPDEFTTYFYTRSDTDRDGYMGDEEWNVTTSQIYRPYKDVDYNKYTYWDQDKDGRLDNNEVKTLVEKTGLYAKWDTNLDGKIDSPEFARGTFAAYDDNNDGSLSLGEWSAVLR